MFSVRKRDRMQRKTNAADFLKAKLERPPGAGAALAARIRTLFLTLDPACPRRASRGVQCRAGR